MTSIIAYDTDCIDENGKWNPPKMPRRCWHDGHMFDTVPVPLPVDYDEKRQCFTVWGVFCSFQCAKAYQISQAGFNTDIQKSWLAIMAKKHFGLRVNEINPAPPAYLLLNNSMTIDEFRKHCENNERWENLTPTLLPACMAAVRGSVSATLQSITSTRDNETIKDVPEPMKATGNKTQQQAQYKAYLEEKEAEEAAGKAAVDDEDVLMEQVESEPAAAAVERRNSDKRARKSGSTAKVRGSLAGLIRRKG